jgi:16S rRNA (cytosine967-C5)-methyltransferase
MKPSPKAAIPRAIVLDILYRFEKSKTRLDQLFFENQELTQIDKWQYRFVKNVVSGVVRHLLYLDWAAAAFYRGRYKKIQHMMKSVFRASLYEIIFMKTVPDYAAVNEYVHLTQKKIGTPQSKAVNATLRAYLRNPHYPASKLKKLDIPEWLSVQYSFPLWLVKRWLEIWGAEETEELLKSMNETPIFEARINLSKIKIEDFWNRAKDNEIQLKQSVLSPQIVKVEKTQNILNSDLIKEGFCSIQDESAYSVVNSMNIEKNDLILDMCAAPGGKYTQILERQKAKLAVAVDVDLNRLKKVKQNIKRLQLDGGQLVCCDAKYLPFKIKFSKILLDAPCSGLGVISKHPDIKWRRTLPEITAFSQLQQQLLENGSQYLASNGKIYYSTCTIDTLENEEVIKRFIENNPKFRQAKLNNPRQSALTGSSYRFYPHKDKTDGGFLAVLEKRNSKRFKLNGDPKGAL